LQVAKRQTWGEKERLSHIYEEERRINLANKVNWNIQYIPYKTYKFLYGYDLSLKLPCCDCLVLIYCIRLIDLLSITVQIG
jgi:hypothetical protein